MAGTGEAPEQHIDVGRGFSVGDRIVDKQHGIGTIVDKYDGKRAVFAIFDKDDPQERRLRGFEYISKQEGDTGATGARRRRRTHKRKTLKRKTRHRGRK